jgi:hypothetical protein
LSFELVEITQNSKLKTFFGKRRVQNRAIFPKKRAAARFYHARTVRAADEEKHILQKYGYLRKSCFSSSRAIKRNFHHQDTKNTKGNQPQINADKRRLKVSASRYDLQDKIYFLSAFIRVYLRFHFLKPLCSLCLRGEN